jgi:hypothetical protein
LLGKGFMHSTRLAIAGVLLLSAASGCIFYSDDDDDCQYGGTGAEPGGAAYYDPGQRNPETGVCEYFGGGGGGGCGDPCNPCPEGDQADKAPAPTWGYCESQCTGLDEASCTTASGCRAIYTSNCITDDCADQPVYVECWSTDMQGPIQGGGCEGLDAYSCSMHDDCSAVHYPGCDQADAEAQDPIACPVGAFGYCTPENGDVNPGRCWDPVTCDAATPDCPDGTTPGIANGCYTGYCIPLDECEEAPACATLADEEACIARADCKPSYHGEDCTCDDMGVCICETYVYDDCQELPPG